MKKHNKTPYILIFIAVSITFILGISIFMIFEHRKIAKNIIINNILLHSDDGIAYTIQKSWGNGLSPYETVGSCDFTSRKKFIELIDPKLHSLEIGPYFRPALTGKYVKYFDILSKEELIKQANKSNFETNDIPNIDYVESLGDLSIIKEKFDVVFSSHNIEHQVNLVKHLNQVSDLLNDGGKFYLIIPDKRYCFDHFIAETPLSEVLAVNEMNLEVHSLQTILSTCESTNNVASYHWSGKPSEIIGKDLNCYKDNINNFRNAKETGDITLMLQMSSHKWRFTPQSFSYIIDSLNKMNLIDLNIEKIYCTKPKTQEFAVILYKTSKSESSSDHY